MTSLTTGATTGVRTSFNLANLAVALGLSGLGGAWSTASITLGAPSWIEDVIYLCASAAMLVLVVMYGVSLIRGGNRIGEDLVNPATGFSMSYFPLIGVLLGVHFHATWPQASEVVIVGCTAVAGVLAARLFAQWLLRPVAIDSLHPAYFLPLVAGAFVTSVGLSVVHASRAAMAAFGIGVFFWVVVGTIVMGRLITGAPLPARNRPLLSILLAPPATAGIAWSFLTGGRSDTVADMLLGIIVLLAVVQLFLLAEFTRTPVTIGLWAFCFPSASVSNFTLRWLAGAHLTHWHVLAWSVLGLGTLIVAGVAIRTTITTVQAATTPNRPAPRHAQTA